MKKTFYLLIIWFILSGFALSIAYNLLTTASDIVNGLGIIIIIVVFVVSIETRCLTIFKKKEK
jgi:hypothetical protein